MNVKKFMLKKFPTNQYIDCPVPQHHWETIQEYAEKYYQWKIKTEKIEIGDNEKFGKIQHYEIGDVVVWRGQDPCIGVVKGRIRENHKLSNDYNSLHYSNLRLATVKEKIILGEKNILLID